MIIHGQEVDVRVKENDNFYSENRLVSKYRKKLFWELVEKDLDCNSPTTKEIFNHHNFFFSKGRGTLRDKHRFNMFLRRLVEDYEFEMFECILFFEERCTKEKKIISFLDEENREVLTEEMSKKYKIKRQKNKLYQFLKDNIVNE